jgi:NADH dehydrogenase [ubiquinone] 1 alpha subcomplex assembly factor 1
MRNRVKSIGIGLTDRIDGPFDLRIHKIWATNGMDEQDAADDKLICGAHALPVDEGVRTGWAASKLHEKEINEKETNEQQTSPTKKKGLQGLRSEWDE